MDLTNFRMRNNEFLIKYPYVVPEQPPLIISGGKLAVCMANNGQDTKQTRQIYRIMHFVRNDEE